MIKLFRDLLLAGFLFFAMSRMGQTQELQSDDGGVKLINGCYTLIVVVDGDHGKEVITVQDCRGGRPI